MSAHPVRWTLAALAALTLLIAACDEGGETDGSAGVIDAGPGVTLTPTAIPGGEATPTPTSTASATPTATTGTGGTSAPARQTHRITVTNQGLEPARIALPVGVPAHISVANSDQTACSFFVGDYLRGVLVDPGKSGEATFPVPASSGGAFGDTDQIEMGCVGTPDRRGQVTAAEAGPGAPGNPDPLPPQTGAEQRIRITITENGLEPAKVQLRPDTRVLLEVVNQSGPCVFVFGEWLSGLLLPNGTSGSAAFITRSELNLYELEDDPTTRMGCRSDPDRQGTIAEAER